MASKKGRDGKRQHAYRPPRDKPGAAAVNAEHSCPDCGKGCYRTRADAEASAQQRHPGIRMRFYRCPPGRQWWHYTSISAEAMGARRARSAMKENDNRSQRD